MWDSLSASTFLDLDPIHNNTHCVANQCLYIAVKTLISRQMQLCMTRHVPICHLLAALALSGMILIILPASPGICAPLQK